MTTRPQAPPDSGFQLVVKGAAYSLASMMFVRALATASSIVVARLLGKENLGMLAVINHLINLGSLFALIGIPVALTRYVAYYAAASPLAPNGHSALRTPQSAFSVGSVVGTSLFTLLVALLLLSGAMFAAAAPIATRIYHEPRLTLLIQIAAGVLALSSLGTGFGQALLQGLREVKRISIINIATSAASLPLVVGLVLAFQLNGAVLAQLLAALLGLALVLISLRRIGFRLNTLRFDRTFWPQLMNLAFPTFLSGLVMTPALWLTTTRLSVTKGFSELGLFNICFGMFQMLWFIPLAVGMPLIPMIAESFPLNRERLGRLFGTSLELVTFASLVLSAAICVFALPAIYLLYGTGYLPAAHPMVIMTGAALLSAINLVLGHYFAGTGKMWTGMAFNLVWFLALVATTLLLVRDDAITLNLRYSHQTIVACSLRLRTALGALGLTSAFWVAYSLMTLAALVYIRRKIETPILYPALISLLSAALTLSTHLFQVRLAPVPYVASGLATLALVAVAAYALLPSKPYLRGSIAVLLASLNQRLRITGVPNTE